MGKVKVDTKQIDRNLKRLAASQKKVRNKALREASQVLATRLESNTPYDSDSGNETHLKDDVTYGNVNADGEVYVGFGKETSWRAHFIEIGTIKQKPQGFIQRTEEEFEAEFIKIMEENLRKGLGL